MTLKFDSNTRRFLIPVYLAWVVCTENIASAHEADYQTATALATNIFHKVNGQWLLAHHHASPIAVNEPIQASDSIQ